MNLPETAELDNFRDQLERILQIEKVAEADVMIKRVVIQQLDAAYMLVQRALVLGRALTQTKARIGEPDRATPLLATAAHAFEEAADRTALDVDSATDYYLFV